MELEFEWDPDKEQKNIIKHGIDFETASLVFNDENRIEFYDDGHSSDEERYITIGMVNHVAIVIMVVYTERDNVLRQYHTKIAAQTRSQIFRQIVQKLRRQAIACQGISAQSDGKYASVCTAKAAAGLCAVLP